MAVATISTRETEVTYAILCETSMRLVRRWLA